MIRALSLSLLHFVWLGTLLGALAALTLRLLAPNDTRMKYGVACAFLVLMVAAPLLTFAMLAPMGHDAAPIIGQPLRFAKGMSNPAMQGPAGEAWVLPVLLAWLGGVIVFGLRAAGGLSLVMSRLSIKTPAPERVRAAAQRIAHEIGLRKLVPVFTSARVSVPIVFGALKPMIVLPCSALTGLSQAQLESILAHELAHIVRHDFLVNCFQSAVEVALFYHPAVWWLSRRIRQERELCCDEMAAATCGDRVLYSRALIALEEGRQELVPAANGGNLRRRIEHLLRQPVDHVPESRAAAGLLAILTCGAVVMLSTLPGMLAQSTQRGNADQQERERRVRYANERYSDTRPGSETPRGRIYLEKGPPDEIESHPRDHREVWRYQNGDTYEFGGPEYELKAEDSPASHFPSTGERRLRIVGTVQKTKLISAPQPQYPATARLAQQEGVVTLAVLINKDGNVQDVAVMSGAPLLAEAAANAVRQWTYRTTLLNGNPVEVVTTVDVPFRLAE
jgi:TonB family protein